MRANVTARKSEIHGYGLFALRNIRKGQLILDPLKRRVGGYNHSCEPNTDLVVTKYKKPVVRQMWIGRCLLMEVAVPEKTVHVANKNIRFGEEVTMFYSGEIPKGWCKCPKHRGSK